MNTPPAQNPQLTEALKAQMADIVTPAPVSAWPPAWGWWLVGALALLALIALGSWLVHCQRKNRYRKQAQRELKRLKPTTLHEQVQNILTVTKACVLSVRPTLRSDIAQLPAEAWVQWLNSTGRKEFFDAEATALMTDFAYQPSDQPPSAKLTEATHLWLREHRLTEANHA